MAVPERRASRRTIDGMSLPSRPLLFASGEDAYVADRVIRSWTTEDGADAAWASEVIAALPAGERAIGALSFAAGAPGILHQVVGSERPLVGPETTPRERKYEVYEFPTAEAYADMVRAVLDKIAAGVVRKVVIGRCLDVISDPPLEPAEIIDRLLETRPGRYVFSVPLTESLVDGPLLVGASPELLVSRHGDQIACTPLAGSVPRSADPDEDARRATALQASDKDLAEHAFVVDAIVHALKEVCVDVEPPTGPTMLATDTVWHLASPITARLEDPATGPSALHLAQMLHPTPAVGGVPAAAAAEAIADLEGDLRDYFAGCVGWVDGSGDGVFAITIRAAVIDGARMRLFAGAGIVAGSDPDSEVRETGAKLATMTKVAGLS
ncbi:isochorismate synthase [Nocardioides humilatus]|uniref:isochorismate synthase n=2 Tax=Nocardioides humilatus TaxID=2607660 RepID=A0A5B1LE87_9ACTN|nr:isochorismate synthase [Nocardioides humilatus]